VNITTSLFTTTFNLEKDMESDKACIDPTKTKLTIME
jgi:hypothetical protein